MTKVHIIGDEEPPRRSLTCISKNAGFQNIIKRVHPSTELANKVKSSMQLEKEAHNLLSDNRRSVFKDILYNNQGDKKASKYIIYDLVGIIATLLSTCIYTLIPYHNIIEHPQYWYEFPLQIQGNMLPIWASNIVLRCYSWMNLSYIKQLRHVFTLWFVVSIVTWGLFCTLYILWTYFLHYQWPLPFICVVYGYPAIFVLYFTLWHILPYEWRKDDAFKRRLKYFMLATGFYQGIALQYQIIAKLFSIVSEDYQWIVAVILPISREMNGWIISSLAQKACNGDVAAVHITCSHNLCLDHTKFIAYCIGNSATPGTAVVIMATDYAINIYITLKIIWGRLKNPMDTEKHVEWIQ